MVRTNISGPYHCHLGGDMGQKLKQGDRFPSITLKLASGERVTLPGDMPGRYAALLFYRGHW